MASTLEIMNAAKLSLYDNKPVATLFQAVVQSIPNSAYTPITFDSVSIDNWGGWSVGDTTKYTVKLAGKYRVSGSIYFGANATGARFARTLYNGAGVSGAFGEISLVSGTNSGTVIPGTSIIQAVVGDFFQLALFQNSGGALNTVASASNSSIFTVEWISF